MTFPPATMARAGAVSLAAHLAAAGLLLVGALAFPHVWVRPPEQRAEVEILTGTDAEQTGAPAPASDLPQPLAASAPAPPPAEPAAPQPATAAPPQPATAAVPQPASPPPPPAVAPLPVPRAAPVLARGESPPARSAPAAPERAGTVPPPAAGAAPPISAAASLAPAAPPASPAPAQAAQASQRLPAPATGAPTIRVGDGIAIASAEIEDSGTVHPAAMDFGNAAPEYPPEAARKRERGSVTVRVFIAADGHVEHVAVVRSSGSALLDRAATDRIATWHFTPARQNGRPVPDIEEQTIRFVPD